MFMPINRINITNFLMTADSCFHFLLAASFTYMLYNKESVANTITSLTRQLLPGLVKKISYIEIKELLRNMTSRTKELTLYTSTQTLHLAMAQLTPNLSTLSFDINKGVKVKRNPVWTSVEIWAFSLYLPFTFAICKGDTKVY